MKTSIQNVTFFFDSKCISCGYVDEDTPEPIQTNLAGIMDGGIPICQICDRDLLVMNECEVIT